MKRFLLFICQRYYPSGGWEDFAGDFDTIEDANDKLLKTNNIDFWHIADTQTKKIVAEGERD